MGTLRTIVTRLVVAACGDNAGNELDGGGGGVDAGTSIDAPLGARPHPLYPSLDLDTLPGAGGAGKVA